MDEKSLSSSSVGRRQKWDELKFKRMGVLFVFLLLFPVFPLLLSVVFGALLAWAEKISFLEGALYVASNLLQMGTPLTDFTPQNPAGVFIDVYVSVVAVLVFGILLNLVNLFQVPLVINNAIEYFLTTNNILVPLVALMLVIPVCFGVIAVVFGSILGAMEGWQTKDGILYVFSNLLGLGTNLVEDNPDTSAGDILDIVVSSMALGFIAIFIDYVTVLNPARCIRRRSRDLLVKFGITQLSSKNTGSELHPLDYDQPSRHGASSELDHVDNEETKEQITDANSNRSMETTASRASKDDEITMQVDLYPESSHNLLLFTQTFHDIGDENGSEHHV
jgi:hypothetical protein